jgi:hypothetical protein
MALAVQGERRQAALTPLPCEFNAIANRDLPALKGASCFK